MDAVTADGVLNKGISARDIVKAFGDPPTVILKDVSLDIQRGDFVSIIGKSGSGKSTLLYALSGLDDPTSGKIYVDGEDIHSLSRRAFNHLRNKKIGFVFQFHYLLPELTMLENVLMPARKVGDWRKRQDFAISLLETFGIGNKKNSYPNQVSGGETQRAAIARSLIMEPDYLFADEPTGNLDTKNGEIVMEIFAKINKDLGTTITMVTHDPDFAAIASRKVYISDGALERSEKF